ncbi:DUF6282 family protein [Chelativorans sp. SCAU2101]|mgnify:CR=1 FL=1|jgi:hypothetical protein|uniref:DUF6282 family protein n=1 Tax=Chelativorans petroleitrophicus TaxID=2975484 RepID=A0A9X3B5P8_9HYPH|nr:DUF6282 family protein [Chelativorans petroleitrophicus]MCT8989047.1 DUF6282 family protein [Chelativorans petroleitrophicus]
MSSSSATNVRDQQIAELLVGAVDLHCHSGPAVMPRILDHHDQMVAADAAGFKAVVTKDHYYLGTPHCMILHKLCPDLKVRMYSGIVLNNASGGINPHAVDHAAKLGAKIVWMPTFSAANHIAKTATEAKGFPKVAGALEAIPLSVLDANGRLTDDTLKVLDIIAAADIILASGHLGAAELHLLFEEAKRRGVRKMLVNHPTYVVGCTDEDIRQMVSIGVKMEHSITQFIEGRGKKFEPEFALHLIEVAGVENTLFGSDLGLQGALPPVEGYRTFVGHLLDLGVEAADIRTMISTNGSRMLNLS